MDSNIIGSGAGLTASTVKYNFIYGSSASWGTDINTHNIVPLAGTISNLYITQTSADTNGFSRTYSIVKNGASTNSALVATVATAGTSANDTTHSITVAAGDTVAILSTAGGTTTTTGVVKYTMKFTANPNQSVLFSSTNSAMGTTFPVYIGIQGGNFDATTANNVEAVMPTTGTFKNAYVNNNTAIATGANLTYTLFQNGSPTSIVITATGNSATTTFSDTTHSVTVAAGDRFYWKVTTSSAPTTKYSHISMEFDPTTNGESVHTYGSSAAQPTTGQKYNTLMASNGNGFGATSTGVVSLSQAAKWYNLYVYEQTSIATGSLTYAAAIDAVSSVTTTITSGQTGNDIIHNNTSSVGSIGVWMSVTASGTPTVSLVEWGIVSFMQPTVLPIGEITGVRQAVNRSVSW